jgi:hypothetical protein
MATSPLSSRVYELLQPPPIGEMVTAAGYECHAARSWLPTTNPVEGVGTARQGVDLVDLCYVRWTFAVADAILATVLGIGPGIQCGPEPPSSPVDSGRATDEECPRGPRYSKAALNRFHKARSFGTMTTAG